MGGEGIESLDSVLDPALQDASHVAAGQDAVTATPDGGASGSQTPAPQDHAAAGPAQGGNGKRKGARRSKIVPGSTADFRRKEANRLAAERSRRRAAETAYALNTLALRVRNENEQLKKELALLESTDVSAVTAASGSLVTANGNVTDSFGSNAFDAEGHPSSGIGGEAEDAGQDTQAQANAQAQHTGNILEALMSVEEASETEWMQGVESLMDDPEASGRLGELAAVAAGQEGRSADGQETGGGQPTAAAQADARSSTSAQQQKQDVDSQNQQPQSAKDMLADGVLPVIRQIAPFSISAATAATASAMAVALNAEMERILRNEVALTRAATSAIERRIAAARANENPDAAATPANEQEPPGVASTLPQEILSPELDVLQHSAEVAAEEASRLRDDMPALRRQARELKVDKVAAEGKLAEIVGTLQTRSREGLGTDLLEKVRDQLSTISGYVGALLGTPDNKPGSLSFGETYTSPAVARRRRGRPRKGQQALFYESNVLLGPFPPAGSATATPPAATSKGKRASSKQKKATRASGSRGNAAKAEHLSQSLAPPAQPETQVTADEGDDAAGRAAAEDLFLSQLRNETRHGLEEDHLDEATLSRLLPSGQADTLDGNADGSQDGGEAARAADAAIEDGTLQEGGDGAHDSAGAEADGLSTPGRISAVSRLRAGGPGTCEICSRTETSTWRKLRYNGEPIHVCNACGLYYHKFGVIRPPELWGDGTTVRKRRSGAPRQSMAGEQDVKRRKLSFDMANPAESDEQAEGDADGGDASRDQQTDQLQQHDASGSFDGSATGIDNVADPEMALRAIRQLDAYAANGQSTAAPDSQATEAYHSLADASSTSAGANGAAAQRRAGTARRGQSANRDHPEGEGDGMDEHGLGEIQVDMPAEMVGHDFGSSSLNTLDDDSMARVFGV